MDNEKLLDILENLYFNNNLIGINYTLKSICSDSNSDCCLIDVNKEYDNSSTFDKAVYPNNSDYLKYKMQLSDVHDDSYVSDKYFFFLNNKGLNSGSLVLFNPDISKIDKKTYTKICNYLAEAVAKIKDNEKLINDSYYDNLLDIKNRNSFIMDCDFLKKSKPNSIGIVYFDINGLHEANNNYGHNYGDVLLKNTVSIITSKIRKDEFYRVGGDEFITMIPNCDYSVIVSRVKDVYEKLCEKNISVSYGIAYSNDNPDIETLKNEADSNMYIMKNKHYGNRKRIRK